MTTDDKSYAKRLAIVGVVLLVIVAIIIIVVIPKQSQPTGPVPLNAYGQKVKQLELADSNMFAAALDVYYYNENRYPETAAQVLQYQEPENVQIVSNGINQLNKLKYVPAKDGQSYSFTYLSVDKQTQTVKGNYKEKYGDQGQGSAI